MVCGSKPGGQSAELQCSQRRCSEEDLCEVSSSARSGCWSEKLWPGALRLAEIFSYVGLFNEFTFDEVNILPHELVDRLPVIIYLHGFPMSPLLLLADAGQCYLP